MQQTCPGRAFESWTPWRILDPPARSQRTWGGRSAPRAPASWSFAWTSPALAPAPFQRVMLGSKAEKQQHKQSAYATRTPRYNLWGVEVIWVYLLQKARWPLADVLFVSVPICVWSTPSSSNAALLVCTYIYHIYISLSLSLCSTFSFLIYLLFQAAPSCSWDLIQGPRNGTNEACNLPSKSDSSRSTLDQNHVLGVNQGVRISTSKTWR